MEFVWKMIFRLFLSFFLFETSDNPFFIVDRLNLLSNGNVAPVACSQQLLCVKITQISLSCVVFTLSCTGFCTLRSHHLCTSIANTHICMWARRSFIVILPYPFCVALSLRPPLCWRPSFHFYSSAVDTGSVLVRRSWSKIRLPFSMVTDRLVVSLHCVVLLVGSICSSTR